MSQGATITTALSLAATLGIADHLADGPRGIGELAQATSTHPRSLYRLLRLLSSMGVFAEIQPDIFALTPLGECLRSGVPGSLRSMLMMSGLKIRFHTFAEALHSVRTGEPVFERTTGMEFFDYLAAHPEEGEIFNKAMSDFSRSISSAVVQAYDFSGIGKIIDIGGGHGSLLTTILQGFPNLTGILFDSPHVAESARQTIAAAGLADRCEILGGDFFQSVPAGGDVYLMKSIIHDWNDERAVTILKNCRRAMANSSRLLLIEMILPAGAELHPGKFVDFIMLTNHGGLERREDEHEKILQEAGFRLNRVIPTASPMSIIEGMPE
ncbi:MAG: methyltransferase [Blastocatellia bacterium]|nr:methyltransferase [Blastocatellia bacterium]